ncbi:hypothetical protein FB107DRAFT_280618 [Schizophyllum commune]
MARDVYADTGALAGGIDGPQRARRYRPRAAPVMACLLAQGSRQRCCNRIRWRGTGQRAAASATLALPRVEWVARHAVPSARPGICRDGERARFDSDASAAVPASFAHPRSARAYPAFAGDAELDGQRGGGDSSDASRQMPRRERSTRDRARHEARRTASSDAARERGNALEREAEAAGRTEVAGGARDALGAGAARARATTSGSARRGDGGWRAGDDERDPASAEATTTSIHVHRTHERRAP